MKIPAMRATLGLIVLAACGVARARAQATPDTGVVVQGFLQHDPTGGWTIVVPESFEAGGVRTFVLQLQGKASRSSPLLDRYVGARGRDALGAHRPSPAPRPAPLRGDARRRLPRCRAAAPGRRVETRPLRRPSGRVSGRRVRYHRRVRGLLGVDSASPSVRFKVGLVQMAMSADPDANLQTAVAKVAEAAVAGAQLVCLPELFRSRYFAQREDPASFDLAEPLPGPSTEALARAAQRAGVVVIAPVFERRAPGLYHNSAAVIDADGRLVGIYRKLHIPDDPAYYEKFYFAPGDLGFRAFDTRVGRIGTLVCWDQWYPEG